MPPLEAQLAEAVRFQPLIELVEALEENLAAYVAGFHIDDEDLENLLSVRDAVDYVSAKLQAA